MMLTEKLQIFMRIYKQFDPSFSPICYYLFIFGLLQISIGLSVFRFVANKYKQISIQALSTIHNIQSDIWWMMMKIKNNNLPWLISKSKQKFLNISSYHLLIKSPQQALDSSQKSTKKCWKYIKYPCWH